MKSGKSVATAHVGGSMRYAAILYVRKPLVVVDGDSHGEG